MLNPITYTENIARDFLRYQLSAYPLADEGLQEQMRRLLNLDETRKTPLLKGPFVSLSPMFRRGAAVEELVQEGLFHPQMTRIVPHSHLYGHQESAIRAILGGASTLVSTGTGSGKTEAFLYPIISRCLELRDHHATAGITAVIVYPMNALAEDQVGRLRELLCGTGISFGVYIGKTPERPSGATGIRLPATASRQTYLRAVEEERRKREPQAVYPPEERVSRQEMRQPGNQPRILLTNVKQLELLLTRQRDVELFDDARLEFLVVDEAHTFSGAMGAETACLLRRLRSYCGRSEHNTVCIATSATIADPESGHQEARTFAGRFFGIAPQGVEFISEIYQEQSWASELKPSSLPAADPLLQLENALDVLRAVDTDAPGPAELKRLQTYLQTLLGRRIDTTQWRRDLYDALSQNETVFEIAQALTSPRHLFEICQELQGRLGRPIHEAEVLLWLAMGAAARKDKRPLLRPVVHAFLRGIDGAVVTFPTDQEGPRLFLAAEDAVEADDSLRRLPVMSCTTCGQHYFQHFVADFHYYGDHPGGGELLLNTRHWSALEPTDPDCSRVVLLDRLVFDEEGDDGEEYYARSSKKLSLVHLCRYCGGLHSASHTGRERSSCSACSRPNALVTLYAVQQKEKTPGLLNACIACGQPGRRSFGRYREPARPLRAVHVSDIHILAQSMLQYAQRKRLLIFADNRQDAAFQAGWMRDHARRFRLRALMDSMIHEQGPLSPGDLVYALDQLLERDDALSRALLPEVWRVARKERAGRRHQQERLRYLRFQVIRELAAGNRQRMGLEPWGRMRVLYQDLVPEHPFFARWAPEFDLSEQELHLGVESFLDSERRKGRLYDPETQLYSKYWRESSQEVAFGYIPVLKGGPSGLKLRRLDTDNSIWVKQLISSRGQTAAMQAVQRKWDLPQELLAPFLEELWELLTQDLKLFVPVSLTGYRGRALGDAAGTYQIDSDSLTLSAHRGVWTCQRCARSYPRPAPRNICMGWNCYGELQYKPEDPEDYDLMLLREQFTMVRPREHSAQVPASDRERLERIFKSNSEEINILVSTPTLELGVDIGALDSVLMRNIPPLPANYWQRAGRAGRRHRMAVNLSYARPVSHDRAYFDEPLKMLDGQISPPSFNLKNDVMVQKHVHSAVLGILHRWARHDDTLSQQEKVKISTTLNQCFPTEIRSYLFEPTGEVRREPFDTSALTALTRTYRAPLLDYMTSTFSLGWPAADKTVVQPELLGRYIDGMGEELALIIGRLRRRLQWALDRLDRLDQKRRTQGSLNQDDEEDYKRCHRLVKRLKGELKRYYSEAEGVDDTYTFAVLAAEGYLPGYGLDNGAIAATHIVPTRSSLDRDWTLRRAPSLAIREYVPGNLIYANGRRFQPRYFQLLPQELTIFQVDTHNQAVQEEGAGSARQAARMGEQHLAAFPICDVHLPQQAEISDDETYRFQLPSAIYGYELARHDEGLAFQWGRLDLLWRRSVHMRLVNIGPASQVRSNQYLGFPICTVCGTGESPFIPDEKFANFQEAHLERCGYSPERVGIFADIVADSLALQDMADRNEGYSLLEALRHGASRILEMELDDLQILAIGHPGGTSVTMVLYDPMPGGSGLLEQLTNRFAEVFQQALELVSTCPSDCESACVDCLLNYRNAHYHALLDRHRAKTLLEALGHTLTQAHPIPPRLPASAGQEQERPTNIVEKELEEMLLRAGFPKPMAQKVIDLGLPLGQTIPDFYYEDPFGRFEGICIYLDGKDKYQADPGLRAREKELRQELEALFYRVIEIDVNNLTDRTAMTRHMRNIAQCLSGREAARALRDDDSWFDAPPVKDAPQTPSPRTAPAKDKSWQDIELLMPSVWMPLVQALIDAGLPGPDKVGEDIIINGRVSDARTLLVWHRGGQHIALVEESVLQSAEQAGFRALIARPDAQDLGSLIATLREYLFLGQ